MSASLSRSLAAVAAIVALVPAPARAQSTAAPADGWRQFRGSPSLTGVSSAALPASLKLLWTYEVGDIIAACA